MSLIPQRIVLAASLPSATQPKVSVAIVLDDYDQNPIPKSFTTDDKIAGYVRIEVSGNTAFDAVTINLEGKETLFCLRKQADCKAKAANKGGSLLRSTIKYCPKAFAQRAGTAVRSRIGKFEIWPEEWRLNIDFLMSIIFSISPGAHTEAAETIATIIIVYSSSSSS